MNEELAMAVHQKDFSTAKALIEQGGCNVNTLHFLGWVFGDNTGTPLLHTALENKDKPMIKLLLENGANPNVSSTVSLLNSFQLAQERGFDLSLCNNDHTQPPSENHDTDIIGISAEY
ncbi:MAG: hypothetical protein P8P83_02145 [Rickettsiaceae bacterium]|nr:hypothetical protein [Rickettsiaceae bacterium]